MNYSWVQLLLLGIMMFCGRVNPSARDNQVYITNKVCDSTLHLGSSRDNDLWKRLLFAKDEMCRGVFKCQIAFTASAKEEEICVDYARLKPHGDKTWIRIYQENVILEVLTSRRYPKGDRSMQGKICVSPGSNLVLSIKAECSTPLDRAVVGWFYVYVQPKNTGEMFFLDGSCKHRHTLTEGMPITVRSQLWADMGYLEIPRQNCSLRLSLAPESGYYGICISWSSLSDSVSVIPAGVQVNIKKVQFSEDSVVKSYLTLSKGDSLPSVYQCHGLSDIQETVIEVFRDRRRTDIYGLQDGTNLFSLKAGIGIEHAIEGTDNSIADEENQDTEHIDRSSSFTTTFIFLKIVLGSAAVISLCCCVCFYAIRAKRTAMESAREDEGRAGQSQPQITRLQGSVNSISGSTGRPEAHPMLPVTAPTAPAGLEQEQDTNNRTSWGTRTSDLPPSYEDLRDDRETGSIPSAPPAYSDLFPTNRM